MLLSLACLSDTDDDDESSLFCYRLKKQFRIKRVHHISRWALLDPMETGFIKLYQSGCTQSMITYTGFDYASFDTLLALFQPYFNQLTPYSDHGHIRKLRKSNGQKRKVTALICLGLVLCWTRTKGPLYSLQMDFGMSHSCLILWLRFARRVLVDILCNNPLSLVRRPTQEEVATNMAAVALKYPLLPEVCGIAHCLHLGIQSTKDDQVQSMFYNGWTHGHYVSSVLVFGFDGLIKICGLNAPDNMHDRLLADHAGVYEILQMVFDETGGKVVVDSAFHMANNNNFIIKSSQNVPNGNRLAVRKARDATKLRQVSEWGMGGFQSSFSRTHDEMPLETFGERRLIFKLLVYLFNYRTNVVGCNKIRSTFMPNLEARLLNARSVFTV
jgi:hypothetical protein